MELPYLCEFGADDSVEEEWCNITKSFRAQTSFQWQYKAPTGSNTIRFRTLQQNPGAQANVISPVLPFDSKYKCLTFNYQAYGRSIGEVVVNDETNRLIWKHNNEGIKTSSLISHYISSEVFLGF